MLKKTLLSLAIAASTAGLTACNISSTADSAEVDSSYVTAGTAESPGYTTPVFSAANATLPLINDLIFANASVTDGTASAGDSIPPVTTALNSIDGASIVAPIDIEFSAALDEASLQEALSVNLIKLRNSKDDPRIDALDLAGSIMPVAAELWGGNPIDTEQPMPGTDYTVSYLTLDDGAVPVLRINLLNPLDSKTKYIVALTNKIKDSNGDDLHPSSEYELLAGDIILPSSALEPVRGAVKGWEGIASSYLSAVSGGVVGQDNIVLSYAFTTGGTTEVLTSIAAPQLFVEQLAKQPAKAEGLYLAALAGGAMQGGMSAEDAAAYAQGEWMANIVIPSATAEEIAIVDPASPTDAELTEIRASETYQAMIVGAASSPQVIAGITATLATPKAQEFKLITTTDSGSEILSGIEGVPLLGDLFGLIANGLNLLPGVPEIPAGQAAYPVKVDSSEYVSSSDALLGISFMQGQIALPSGLTAPAMTNAAALASGDATTIAGAVKLSYATDSVWSAEDQFNPPSDNMKFDPATGKLTDVGVNPVKDSEGHVTGYTGGMTNVTYRYPLVELDQTKYAPVFMTVPSKSNYSVLTSIAGDPQGKDCSFVNKFPVIIYVHGITTDRTSSMGIGTKMALNCYVTVAIDLPLHGVAPLADDRNGTTVNNPFLAFNVEHGPFADAIANMAEADSFEYMEERHNNIASQAGTNARVAMDFDGTVDTNGEDGTPALGHSGAHFINLGNMGRLRDSMRQAVVDLLHLNATLGSIDVTGDGAPDLDTSKVYLSGNSLGGIIGATFVAVNNDPEVQRANGLSNGGSLPKIQAAVLASPGASLPKMLENSPAIAPRILGGLGLAQDSVSLQKYESMLQAALNSVDPINFASTLKDSDTPIMAFNMIGGGTCPNFDLATGTCGDGGDRIPAAFIQAFDGKYPPDHVVPNNDYFKAAETNPYVNIIPALGLQNLESSAMPLAGTTPFAEQMGLTLVDSANISSVDSDKVYIPFNQGSHVTFVTSDDNAVFNTMAQQMTSFFDDGTLNSGVIDGIATEAEQNKHQAYTPASVVAE